MKIVYLVESGSGIIYSIMYSREDAERFVELLNSHDKRRRCKVVPRTVYCGQPPFMGFNK